MSKIDLRPLTEALSALKAQFARMDGKVNMDGDRRQMFMLGRAVSHALGSGSLRPTAEEIKAAAKTLSISIATARRALDNFNYGPLT